MTQHIGIVACSAEGAALCYRTICTEAPAIMGAHAHPEVTMHTFSLGDYMRFIGAGDWDGVAQLMRASCEKLASCGADFAICPDNTIHRAFSQAVKNSTIPWLHIAEEVATSAQNRKYRKAGILGTKYLMEGPVYVEKFAQVGIVHELPPASDRIRIHEIIMDELVYGNFYAKSRDFLCRVIQDFKNNGCDAVVLACTEIPLLVSQEHSVLPTLDSTRILARAALARALDPP